MAKNTFVAEVTFKLITLLSWDLQNQFGVVYWAIRVITNTVN